MTKVDGNGNSTFVNDYRYIHLDPTVGTNYYRLSQTDFDVTTQVNFMKDKKGEHFSFFIEDPNGFVIEFKSFKNEEEVFVS